MSYIFYFRYFILSNNLSIYLSIYLSICLFIFPIYLDFANNSLLVYDIPKRIIIGLLLVYYSQQSAYVAICAIGVALPLLLLTYILK